MLTDRSSEKISIIHLMWWHRSQSKEEILGKAHLLIDQMELDEKALSSEFCIAQTIMANPDADFFVEGRSTVLNSDDEIFLGIFLIFPDGFPAVISDLTNRQKKLLLKEGAPIILLALNYIKKIYPTSTPEQQQELLQLLKQKDFTSDRDVDISNPKVKEMVIDNREQWALDSVARVLENTGNKKAFVIYGGGHNFAARIQQENNRDKFNYVGGVLTFPRERKATDLPWGAKIILNHSIDIKKFREILTAYGKQYSSTSFFKLFSFYYHSSAMRVLYQFSKKNIQVVEYLDVLRLLDQIDASRARLLGAENIPQDLNKQNIPATDHIILDLRKEFIDTQPKQKFEI